MSCAMTPEVKWRTALGLGSEGSTLLFLDARNVKSIFASRFEFVSRCMSGQIDEKTCAVLVIANTAPCSRSSANRSPCTALAVSWSVKNAFDSGLLMATRAAAPPSSRTRASKVGDLKIPAPTSIMISPPSSSKFIMQGCGSRTSGTTSAGKFRSRCPSSTTQSMPSGDVGHLSIGGKCRRPLLDVRDAVILLLDERCAAGWPDLIPPGGGGDVDGCGDLT